MYRIKSNHSSNLGSHDYRTDANSGIHLIKWFDNKGVILGPHMQALEAQIKSSMGFQNKTAHQRKIPRHGEGVQRWYGRGRSL